MHAVRPNRTIPRVSIHLERFLKGSDVAVAVRGSEAISDDRESCSEELLDNVLG